MAGTKTRAHGRITGRTAVRISSVEADASVFPAVSSMS